MNRSTTVVTRPWDDFHRHLRIAELLLALVKYLRPVQRLIVMPNLEDPILTGRDAVLYELDIRHALRLAGYSEHDISQIVLLMTIYLTRATSPIHIWQAKDAGVKAAKLYPHNGTTNSQFGFDYADYFECEDVFEAMAEAGMLLLIHGEHPDEPDHLLREQRFLPILETISSRHQNLKIVLEHISTAAAVEMVLGLPNVAATITGHHLVLTSQDVFGPPPNPHNKCMPIAKSARDRDAVLAAAIGGNPKFFLGSDCAAHPVHKKEVPSLDDAASGVFTGPVLASVVIEVFEEHGALDKLNDFVSGFGADWYGLERNEGEVTFVKEPWEVPVDYDGIVPFCAGQTLKWRMQ